MAVADGADLVVGQSMGAYTAALVAPRLPARLVVSVNAMTPRGGETGGEWWGDVGFAQARQTRTPRDRRRRVPGGHLPR